MDAPEQEKRVFDPRILFFPVITALAFLILLFRLYQLQVLVPAQSKPQRIADSSNWVKLKACADSGLLPTKYCDLLFLREFTPGEEPTRFCNIHDR